MFCVLVGGTFSFGRYNIYLDGRYMSGSLAATCVYECEQTGGCVAKYSGPPRSGNTIVSTHLEYLFTQTSDYSTNLLCSGWLILA